MVANLRLGDTVRLSGDRVGAVRFVGPVHFADGKWVGVELTSPTAQGTHDGMVKGKRYFRCTIKSHKNPNRGVFVKLNSIKSRVRKKKRRKSIFAKDFEEHRASIPPDEAPPKNGERRTRDGTKQPTTSSDTSTQSGPRQRRTNSAALRRKRSPRLPASTSTSAGRKYGQRAGQRKTTRPVRSPRISSSPRQRRGESGRPTSPKIAKSPKRKPTGLRNATSSPGRTQRTNRTRAARAGATANGHKRSATSDKRLASSKSLSSSPNVSSRRPARKPIARRNIRSASSAGSSPKRRTKPNKIKSAPKRTIPDPPPTPYDDDYDDASESSFEEEEGFAWKVACAFISALEVKERLVSPQFIVQGQRFCVRLKRFGDQKIGLHLVQTEQKRYWVHWTMRLLDRDNNVLEERDYMYDFDEYPNAGHKDFFDRVSLDDDNAELTIQVIFHHVRTLANQPKGPLLLPPAPEHQNKPTLVLDLDETLIHSKFEYCPSADIQVKVPIDGEYYKIYVQTRPGVRGFLRRLSRLYELVIFTAGLDYYADAVLNELDQDKLITQRLYRQHCTQSAETYIKDLDAIGRDMSRTILLDDSPQSFAFHPKNSILATSWTGLSNDRELFDMVTILEWLAGADDVRPILDGNNKSPKWLLSQIT